MDARERHRIIARESARRRRAAERANRPAEVVKREQERARQTEALTHHAAALALLLGEGHPAERRHTTQNGRATALGLRIDR